MNSRIDKLLAALAFLVVVIVVQQIGNAPANALNSDPNTQQSLAGLLPEMTSASCKNVAMSSLTPALVASGTAVHKRTPYDVSAADEECWCVFTAAESAATGTGRHFPKGAIVPLRFGGTPYLKCSCDGAAIMTVCPNNL